MDFYGKVYGIVAKIPRGKVASYGQIASMCANWQSAPLMKQPIRILVDADACPVKEIILRLAKRRNIPVTMVIDTSHELDDGYSTVITVDKGADSADYAITGMAAGDDIVVTQDYGLAAMILAKGASAIDQNGMVYTSENIDALLERRYIGQKIRRGGGRTKGPKKRTREDDERFEASLTRMLDEVTQNLL